MLEWITNFLKENEEAWEIERNEKIKEANKEIREWEKLKRFEKIELLRKKWKEKNENKLAEKEKEIDNTKNVWKKEDEKKEYVEKERNIENNTENTDHPQANPDIDWKSDGQDDDLVNMMSSNKSSDNKKEEITAHVISEQTTNNKNTPKTIITKLKPPNNKDIPKKITTKKKAIETSNKNQKKITELFKPNPNNPGNTSNVKTHKKVDVEKDVVLMNGSTNSEGNSSSSADDALIANLGQDSIMPEHSRTFQVQSANPDLEKIEKTVILPSNNLL